MAAAARRRGEREGKAVAALAVAALVAAWARLWYGLDLDDEGHLLAIPWRWALGDRPFVDEQHLVQVAALPVYPFVKLWALAGGGDAGGLVLYGRHLYLAFAVLVAVAVWRAARPLAGGLAPLVALPSLLVVFEGAPALTPTAAAAGLLTVGTAWAARAAAGGPRRPAVLSGVAYGLACVVYPTLVFVVGFAGVGLALAMGRQARAWLASGRLLDPPDPPGPPTGRDAWLAVSAWTAGGVPVLAAALVLVMVLGGPELRQCWGWTFFVARESGQFGGAGKAFSVTWEALRFVAATWWALAGAAALALVQLSRPRLGRLLLPLGGLALLAVAARQGEAAAVVAAGAAAPYLLLFVPGERRDDGARLLLAAWAPAAVFAVMTAFTSSDGFAEAAVGMQAAVWVSLVLLVWALRGEATVAVATVAVVLLALAVGQWREVPGGVTHLDARFDRGPWWGIAVTARQRAAVDGLAADLAAVARPGDRLLLYPRGAGLYLLWDGPVATNSLQLPATGQPLARLPEKTRRWYLRQRVVPDVVVHLVDTEGLSDAELQAGCGGFLYPVVVRRDWYAVHRRPAGEPPQAVLARLAVLP